jgi:hypothetical protein
VKLCLVYINLVKYEWRSQSLRHVHIYGAHKNIMNLRVYIHNQLINHQGLQMIFELVIKLKLIKLALKCTGNSLLSLNSVESGENKRDLNHSNLKI